MNQLKIVLAQLNYSLGDIQYNQDLVTKTIANNPTGDLIVFPELFLTGYPPEDLLLRHGLYKTLHNSLLTIQAKLAKQTVLLGTPRLNGGKLYNSCAIITRDSLNFYDKQFLPNYSVFDEKRYFTKGDKKNNLIEVNGSRLFIAICEDCWHEEIYDQARQQKAEAIILLNASPYYRHKYKVRRKHLRRQQSEHRVNIPIIYLNHVAGQDEIVFDGNSFVMAPDGTVACQLPSFEETVAEITLGETLEGPKHTPLTGWSEVYQALVFSLRDYALKNGFQQVLLGLSGGIDSALTACIARDALGADNVWAISMPSRYTSDISEKDAVKLAQNLGIQLDVLPIEKTFDAFLETLSPTFKDLPADLTEENLQSRVRGTLLMALSNKFGHLVLTTSNKSEIAVGYSTLYGDSAGGFCVLKDIYKTEVYELARHVNAQEKLIPERILTRAPSAELREDQTDQDHLPEYAILDTIIRGFVEKDMNYDELLSLHHDKRVVEKVIRLIKKSEYKRRQSPPGVKTTERAFGRDWRYPISENYPYR